MRIRAVAVVMILGLAASALADVPSSPTSIAPGKAQSSLFFGHVRQARQDALEALQTSVKYHGYFQAATAYRLEDLGLLDWHLARMKEAEDHLRKALSYWVMAEEPRQAARLHLFMALLNEERGLLKESSVELDQALAYYRNILAPDPDTMACGSCVDNSEFGRKLEARRLAYRLGNFFKQEKALDNLRDNLGECAKAWPDGGPVLVQARVDLASGLLEAGQTQEALSLLAEARAWQESHLAPHDLSLTLVLESSAKAFLKAGQKPEALRLLHRAEAIRQKSLALDQAGAELRLMRLADVQALAGESKAAAGNYKKALKGVVDTYGKGHPLEALVQFKKGNYKEAERIWKAVYGPGHPALASCKKAISGRRRS